MGIKVIASFIVKVQASITTSDGVKRTLIYNKDREFTMESIAQPEILTLLAGRPKAYFDVDVYELDHLAGTLKLGIKGEVENQDW